MSGKWQLAGFSSRGHRHILNGQPCQDAIRLDTREHHHGESLVLAVADGHGSARYAETGAQLAVDAAVERLQEFYAALLPDLLSAQKDGPRLSRVLELAMAPTRRQLVQAWVEKVSQHAGRVAESGLLKEYGATLLFVLATPEFTLFGQLGDGDVLQVDASGGISRPQAADPQSFADETASLCQKDAWLQMRLAIQPPPVSPRLLLLSTDGYANSYEDNATFERIGPDYLGLIEAHGFERVEQALPQFLEQVSKQGCGDDVTLGLAYFTAQASAAQAPLIPGHAAQEGRERADKPEQPSGTTTATPAIIEAASRDPSGVAPAHKNSTTPHSSNTGSRGSKRCPDM